MKPVRVIKMCLNKTYNKHWIGTHLSDTVPIRNGLTQGDALLPSLFNFALGYAIRRVQANQDGFKLNGTPTFLVYADGVNLLDKDTNGTKKLKEASLIASKGRAMAQAVSRRPFTTEARVRSRVSPCGIGGGQSGIGTGFSLSISVFFPVNFIPPVLHYQKKKNFITGLHNNPQRCCASVASAAGPFTTKRNASKKVGLDVYKPGKRDKITNIYQWNKQIRTACISK
jgi:hypothetical protein